MQYFHEFNKIDSFAFSYPRFCCFAAKGNFMVQQYLKNVDCFKTLIVLKH